MTDQERQEAVAIIAQHEKEVADSGKNNMVIFDIVRIALAALFTAAVAGNVTCNKAIGKIVAVLKESKK